MWLHQKGYLFEINRDNDQDYNFGNIKLKLNGIQTTITLEQLFLKTNWVEFSKDKKSLKIKGYSVLELLKNNNLKIEDQDIEFNFHSEETGDLKLVSIKNALFMMNDQQITSESLEDFYKNILKLSTPEKEVVEETGTKDTEPQSEEPVLIESQSYERGKLPYLKNGYKEYVNGNFRLLLLKDESSFKATLYELKKDSIDVFKNPEQIGGVDFYRFKVESQVNEFINAKVIDEKLDISFIEYVKEETELEHTEL